MRTPHQASLFRASARLLPSFACLHLSSLRDGIISDIRSSVGRDSISPATRLRDGDRSSYWHTNNHAAPELGRSVELLNFDITHYSEGDACLLYLGTKQRFHTIELKDSPLHPARCFQPEKITFHIHHSINVKIEKLSLSISALGDFTAKQKINLTNCLLDNRSDQDS